MHELISVILPVYNGEQYLEEAIESILNQTYKNFELVIINDGSNDNSIDIIKKYAKIDDRIIVINRSNMGLIATLNEAIEKAKGKFIVRMDQDDISLPMRLEIQYSYMLKKNLDICGGNFITIDENNNVLKKYKVPQTEAEIIITMATNVPFPHPSVMIKKAFLVKNNLKYGLNGYRNAEDLDLWMLMYKNGALFGNIDEVVIYYRILASSMSRKNYKRIKKEANAQFDNFIKNNILNFEDAFQIALQQKNISLEMERNMIRAASRYFLLTHNINLLFRCFFKLKILNITIGLFSFMKLKLG